MCLSVLFLATALKITAAGDAFMVRGFPTDYRLDVAALRACLAADGVCLA